MCIYVFLSLLKCNFISFLMTRKLLHAQRVWLLSFSVSMTPRHRVSSLCPLRPEYQSLSGVGAAPHLTDDFGLSCISRVFVVTPPVCAVHFIGSQGSPFCALIMFHAGHLEPAWCWYVYIMSPSLWTEKLTAMNFAEVYDWSPTASTGTESSSGRILAVRQTSRYTEPVHEWIGNIPVPEDKSVVWWRRCSGKTFGSEVAWRIGPML